MKQRSEETERAIEEAEIRHMGLRLQKGMFENELQRDLPTTPARSDAYQSPPPRFRPLRERPQRSDVARLKVRLERLELNCVRFTSKCEKNALMYDRVVSKGCGTCTVILLLNSSSSCFLHSTPIDKNCSSKFTSRFQALIYRISEQ